MIQSNRLMNRHVANVRPAPDARSNAAREFKLLVLGTLLHVPLGILFYKSSLLGLLSAFVVFAYGMKFALQKQYKLEYVAYVVAYLVGVEVLWRMAGVPVFWEFGKYASSAIMAVALLKRKLTKKPALPLLYFVMLLPALLVTITVFDAVKARGVISFVFSGPLCLFVSCWFFSHLRLNQIQLRRMFLIMIVPIITIACAALLFTVTAENIEFNTESNAATSGGFGPNQVSSVLGLGVFAATTCFILFNNNSKYKLYLIAAMLLMAAQSVMTFSRGGMYNALGALIVVGFFQTQNLVKALKQILPIILLGALFVLLLFPVLNNFTGGKLLERFEEVDTTNRGTLVEADYQVFLENPLGVGVGLSDLYRVKFSEIGAASHTEFSRILSEHGFFGVIALLCLFAMSVLNLKKQNSSLGRALVGGVVVWSILFMFNAGMRLAAPAIIWAISFVTIIQMNYPPRLRREKPLAGNVPKDLPDGVDLNNKLAHLHPDFGKRN